MQNRNFMKKHRIATIAAAIVMGSAAWTWYPGAEVAHAISSCPTDLFSAMTPLNSNFSDPNAVNVGVTFHVNGAPFVRGVKFYKGTGNTGTHVAHLREAGLTSDLASATYTSETSSGWQSVDFGSDVPVQGGATYIVWVSMPAGHYAADGGDIGGGNDFAHNSFGNPDNDVVYVNSGNSSLYEYTSSDSTAPTHASSANYWVSPVVGDTTNPDANGLSVSDATSGPSVTWTTTGRDNNDATSVNPVSTTIMRSGTVVGQQSGGQSSWAYGPNDPTALPGTSYTYS